MFVAALLIGAPQLAQASDVPGSRLRALVSGSLLHLDTPLGTQIPITYSKDGALNGFANGLGSYLGSERDQGRWWVKRNRLCHRWDVWFDARPQCLSLKRRGMKIYWQNEDGKNGTADLVRRGGLQVADTGPSLPRKAKTTKHAALSGGVKATTKTTAKETSGTAKVEASKLAAGVAAEAPLQLLQGAKTQENSVARDAAAMNDEKGTETLQPRRSGGGPITEKIETVRVAAIPLLVLPTPARLGADTAIAAADRPQPKNASSTLPATSNRLTAMAAPGLGSVVQTVKAPAPADKKVVKQLSGAKPAMKRGKAAKAASLVAEPNAKQTYKVSFVEPFDVLNVRARATTESAVVASLRPGAGGIVIAGSCRVDWCPIRHGNVKGWVNRFYLQRESNAGQLAGNVRTSAWAGVRSKP